MFGQELFTGFCLTLGFVASAAYALDKARSHGFIPSFEYVGEGLG
jgi:hypothetical protein